MLKNINRVGYLYIFVVIAIVCSLTFAIMLLVNQQAHLAEMGVSIDRIMVNIELLEKERAERLQREAAQNDLETHTIQEYIEIGQ
jgi:hypothetical protein